MAIASVMRILSYWRARAAPTISKKHPPTDIFGRLLPYNPALEEIATRYNVWRIGPEPDAAVARRATLAALEIREVRSQEISSIDADVEALLAFEKASAPCAF